MINLAQKIFFVGVVFENNNKVYDYISCFGNYRPGSTVIVDSPSTGLTRVKVIGVKPYLGNHHRDVYKSYKPIISMEHQFAVEVMKFKEDLVAIETQEARRREQVKTEIERVRKENMKTDLKLEVKSLTRQLRELEQRIAVL